MCYFSFATRVSAGRSIDRVALLVGDVHKIQHLASLVTGRHNGSLLRAATCFRLAHAQAVGIRLSFSPLHSLEPGYEANIVYNKLLYLSTVICTLYKFTSLI